MANFICSSILCAISIVATIRSNSLGANCSHCRKANIFQQTKIEGRRNGCNLIRSKIRKRISYINNKQIQHSGTDVQVLEYISKLKRLRKLVLAHFPVMNGRITHNFATVATVLPKTLRLQFIFIKVYLSSPFVAFSISLETVLVQPNMWHIKSIIGIKSQIPSEWWETTHDAAIEYWEVDETLWSSLFHFFASFLTERFRRNA